MAVDLLAPHIERVEARLDDAIGVTQKLYVTWQGIAANTGAPTSVVTVFAISDPTVFLSQADWDNMWTDAKGQFLGTFGLTAPTDNPVQLPEGP